MTYLFVNFYIFLLIKFFIYKYNKYTKIYLQIKVFLLSNKDNCKEDNNRAESNVSILVLNISLDIFAKIETP